MEQINISDLMGLDTEELMGVCEAYGIEYNETTSKNELMEKISSHAIIFNGEPTGISSNSKEIAAENEKDLNKLSKTQLLEICENRGFTRFKSKNKKELIDLINNDKPQKKAELMEETPIINTIKINHLKPLIKWSGGKSDEIKMFEQYFPKHYHKYIEPFVGGGSVYFYLNPANAVISDVHSELIDLYSSIGNGDSREIHEFMEQHPNDEETYYKVRDEMEINNSLDSAKRFYYQRKTCFRGMLRYNKHGKFNIPFGKYKTINYSDLLNPDYYVLLSRTEILNKDFEYVFENYNDENNFMFLDPPYDSEFTDYGYCQFGKEEQKKLAYHFKNTKIKCLMVIGKTAFIEELYDGYIFSEYDKKYKFKLYDNRIGDEINTKHLIIKNY